jgi:hypothetical protein
MACAEQAGMFKKKLWFGELCRAIKNIGLEYG